MNKPVSNWSNRDLLDWVKTIGLSTTWEQKIIESISTAGCTGNDWVNVKNHRELAKKFNITQPMAASRVFREFKKIKEQKPQNNAHQLQSKPNNVNNSFINSPIPFVNHMSFSEANRLRIHDKVDHRDQVGRFVYGIVAEKQGSNLKIHYEGWSAQWDNWSDYSSEIHRFAVAGSISKRMAHRFKDLKEGDFVDVNPSHCHPGWKRAEIRSLDPKSGQVQVAYQAKNQDDSNSLYWSHLDNTSEIAEYGSKTAVYIYESIFNNNSGAINSSKNPEFTVGQKVMAKENGKFYNASIKEVQPTFGVLIKWDKWPDAKNDLWIMKEEYNTKIRTNEQTLSNNVNQKNLQKQIPQAKQHQFKVGQTVKCVDTRYKENESYVATIKRVETNRIYVHYHGYSEEHNQWIPKSEWNKRITIGHNKTNMKEKLKLFGFKDSIIERALKVYKDKYGDDYILDTLLEIITRLQNNEKHNVQNKSPKKVDDVNHNTHANNYTQFSVGQPIFCVDKTDNKWYDAKIKQIQKDKVVVQWEIQNDPKFDQWVTSSNYATTIRLKNMNNYKPPHSFKVGQVIKCIDTRYQGNQAYDAMISAIEANRVFVLYKGYPESEGQWINRTEFVLRINPKTVPKKQMNSSKPDESIVRQLQAFGYAREQILGAMRAVKNPQDINEIVDWLEKRIHHSPKYTNSKNSNNSHPPQQNEVVPQKQAPKKIDDDDDDDDNDDDDGKEEMAFLQFLGGLVSMKVVEDYGFGMASEENRIKLLLGLKNVQCCKGTALRDAVLTGIVRLLDLKTALMKLDVIKHKFVHIVLTDGEDTASDSSLDEVKAFFYKLGDELGDLCKTFFIGVGLGNSERAKLASIANLGDGSELYNCEDVDLDKVFARIKIQLGIVTEVMGVKVGNQAIFAAQKRLIANVSEQKFLILFTLDKSGSMAGGRWNRVVRAVAEFCIGMKDHDILGCILFNDKPELLNIF